MKIKPILPVGLFLAAIGCLLIFLMNASATRKKKPLYEVSVIISGVQNNYWDAVKQGMDQASSDFNVDLNFLSLTGENNAVEQESQIAKEIENGAMALIIAPSSSERGLNDAIAAAAKKTAVVMMESESEDESVKTSVSAGNEALGRELGRQILRGEGTDADIAVVCADSGAQYERERLKGLLDELSGYQIAPEVYQYSAEFKFADADIKKFVKEKKPRILVALDAQTLGAAAAADDTRGTAVYGIDSMASIVPYLEKGIIRCAVVPNAYNMGYLSVKAAVETLQGKKIEKMTSVDFAIVTPTNIYSPENQRILFPFVK